MDRFHKKVFEIVLKVLDHIEDCSVHVDKPFYIYWHPGVTHEKFQNLVSAEVPSRLAACPAMFFIFDIFYFWQQINDKNPNANKLSWAINHQQAGCYFPSKIFPSHLLDATAPLSPSTTKLSSKFNFLSYEMIVEWW